MCPIENWSVALDRGIGSTPRNRRWLAGWVADADLAKFRQSLETIAWLTGERS